MTIRRLILGAALGVLAVLPAPASVAAAESETRVNAAAGHGPPLRATIRRTRYGVPHIRARNIEGVTFGFAYAYAEDNFCTIAEAFVTVSGERSRWFGADRSWTFGANDETYNNLDSDFFFTKLNESGLLEELLAEPPPEGPLAGAERAVSGYVRGYNEFLRRHGPNGIGDPRCEGQPWLRPITEIDAYRLIYLFGQAASSGAAIGGIGGAAPLLGPAAAAAKRRQENALARLDPARALAGRKGAREAGEGRRGYVGGLAPDLGSNAYAFGADATVNGRGILLGNPHFPWDGPERMYQVHLTVPGKLDVQGLTLFGIPMVLMGWNPDFAWTHTVATAFRFTPYGLVLDPADPHRYLLDGEFVEMEPTTVTVEVRTPEGAIEERSRTLYDTIWGPVVDELPGIPLPWTPAVAFAMADANQHNIRYLNHFLLGAQAESVAEYDEIQRRFQGIPSVNSLATDRDGDAYYTMQGAIPNVTDSMALSCGFPGIGQAVFTVVGLPVLDGSRSACRWPDDPEAVAPGILPPDRVPTLTRSDYVHNGNDSHWLTNPAEPLEGFDRIVGLERAERSWRTRIGLIMAEQRLAGEDGLPGDLVSRRRLQRMTLGNRQYLGELWRDPLVTLCTTLPIMVGRSGPVDVRPACEALRAWDLHDDLGSNGALLFRRFAANLLANFQEVPTGSQGVSRPGAESLYTRPFSSGNPVETPSGLNIANPLVQAALADAVSDLEGIGAPVDAPLRGWQYDVRGGERIPIHGGPGRLGVFNAISGVWDPGAGYTNVRHGSGLIFAVQFAGNGGCPVAAGTLLTYSQSDNPLSEHAADYSRAYSKKRWHRARHCPAEIQADPQLSVDQIREGG